MTSFRELLVDRMIRVYGFEHPEVKKFCELCEIYKNKPLQDALLTKIVEAHEANPVPYEEEPEEVEDARDLLVCVGYKDGKFYRGPRR